MKSRFVSRFKHIPIHHIPTYFPIINPWIPIISSPTQNPCGVSKHRVGRARLRQAVDPELTANEAVFGRFFRQRIMGKMGKFGDFLNEMCDLRGICFHGIADGDIFFFHGIADRD